MLFVLAKVALLQSTNIWICDAGASLHCMNDTTRGINSHQNGSNGIMGVHGGANTASSIMDTTGTWCNVFYKEQLKAILKNVQYNPKAIFNLFSIEEAIKEDWKLNDNQEGLVLLKDNVMLVFDIKITTKNSVIFLACLQRDHEVGVIFMNTGNY